MFDPLFFSSVLHFLPSFGIFEYIILFEIYLVAYISFEMPGTRFYSSKVKQNQIFISPYALQYGARFEVQQLWHLS